MTSAAVIMDYTGRFSEGSSQIHQMMGYQFEDIMFQWQTQLPELSDVDIIPDHSSIGLHMLDELPELRDDITPIFEPVTNTSFSATELSSFSSPASIYNNNINTCDEIENPAISNTTTPASYRSFINLLQSVPAPQNSFSSEPATSCDPNFSPSISTQAVMRSVMQTPSSLQQPTETCLKGRRARKLCTGEKEVGVRKNSKKAKVVVTTDSGVEKSKQFRAPTKAEHIVRERQRRDDMAVKYNILESLLPSAAKRERAVIVEDAMMFVKDLQHRKEELLKRRSQMTSRADHIAPSSSPPPQQQQDGKRKIKIANQNEDTATRVRVASGNQSLKVCETGSPLSASSSEDLVTTMHQTAINSTNHTLSISKIINPAGSYIRKLQVHGSLLDDEEIQIEVVCSQPRPDFQSLLIQSVELLSLEVRYCSFSRLQPEHFVQCIVTAKPLQAQVRSKIQSSASIIDALQAALEHVQH